MTTEEFNVTVNYRGKEISVPITIEESELSCKINAMLNATEVCYIRSPHDGLIAMMHTQDYDPELLYLIGTAIEQQRQSVLHGNDLSEANVTG